MKQFFNCVFLVAATMSLSCAHPEAGSEEMQVMKEPIPDPLEEWIAREAIPFSLDPTASFNAAVDQVIALLGAPVELLGFGEALHGGEEILILRNRLFQRLAEEHGYSAIAIESSFPRAHLVNDYVSGRSPGSYDGVEEAGFSHGFGKLSANRELVEWMRRYNADPSHPVQICFYGFDSPTEMTGATSPRRVLNFVLDYLASIDPVAARKHRDRIEPLFGLDSDWENPAAMTDPAKSIGLSPAATALRIETENLITELHRHRPELVAKSDEAQYREALHYAAVARQLLNYHAAVARGAKPAELLGMRDASMADNLAYIVSRERGRGKVLAFAHNRHLQRGEARWQWGPELFVWWPAGSHLEGIFGPRYAVIGSAVGESSANGIGPPEEGTFEAKLTAVPGTGLFIPTHRGRGFLSPAIAALPLRSGSQKNLTYFPLTPQSLTDFDWLAVLDSAAYTRGGPALR
jgi:erythromycin esterase